MSRSILKNRLLRSVLFLPDQLLPCISPLFVYRCFYAVERAYHRYSIWSKIYWQDRLRGLEKRCYNNFMVNAKDKTEENNDQADALKSDVFFGADREITVENSDAKVNIKELDNEQIIRYSKKIGSYYVSLIENIAGKSEANNESLGGLPDELKDRMIGFAKCIFKNKELQHLRFELKDNGARDIISEVAEKTGLKEEFAKNASIFELEEISQGVFVLYMDKDLYSLNYNEKAAVAIINKKGVSFILMPKECKIGDYRNILLDETLLHEFHHMVWSFLVNDKIIICDEEDSGVKFCYSYIQDELIAKLTSNGDMGCYTFLSFADKKTLEDFRLNYPGKEKELNEYVLELNGIMYHEMEPIMTATGIKKQDLIYPALEAHNFSELFNNLRKLKTALEIKIIEKKRNENLEENRIWDKI